MGLPFKLPNLGKQCKRGPMPRSQPAPAPAPAAADAADAAEILRAITRIGYLITRARRHDLVRTVAAVPLDRAAVMVLQQLAEAGPVRPGELAARLEVEAPPCHPAGAAAAAGRARGP